MFKSANWISTPKADHFGGASLKLYFPQTLKQQTSKRRVWEILTQLSQNVFFVFHPFPYFFLFLRHWPMGPIGIPCLTPFVVPKAAICRSQKAWGILPIMAYIVLSGDLFDITFTAVKRDVVFKFGMLKKFHLSFSNSLKIHNSSPPVNTCILETVKARAFICFWASGYHDEVLALVFDILHERYMKGLPCQSKMVYKRVKGWTLELRLKFCWFPPPPPPSILKSTPATCMGVHPVVSISRCWLIWYAHVSLKGIMNLR